MRRWHSAPCVALVLLLGVSAVLAETPAETKKEAPRKSEKKIDAKKAATKALVPVFRLDGEVTEKPGDDPFPFGSLRHIWFRELISKLKKAASDPEVKAVVLTSEGNVFGTAQLDELRQALAGLRSAGKDVYAHADQLTLGQYLLFSGASRISVVPTADIWVNGLYGESPYLRGLLDKLGVQPDFLTCGDYKSAAELFMRSGPSPEAEKMQNWLLDSVYDSMIQLIARGRGVDVSKARAWIDQGPYIATRAKEVGLIDAVESRQEFTALLKSKYGKDVVFAHKYGGKKQPQLDLSSPFGFFKVWSELLGEAKKKETKKPAVGIVYVTGPIVLGRDEASPFGGSGSAASSDIRKALDEAASDDSIKAVVLRIDSPGGSAVASEIILDATRRVKAKKPLVVSMGDTAASGGYYVACGADTIFADPMTITGSIGVVAGKLVTNPMWAKVGITFKAYQRGENAGMLASDHAFTKAEREKMRAWMDEIYDTFKGHVVAIRGSRLKKPIDELAGGRVYTGKQALELGLVDKLGSLQDAIQFVAEQAKVTDYEVRPVPEAKNFLEQLIEEAAGGTDDPHAVGVRMPRSLGGGASLLDLALPHLQHLDPQRVALIKQALLRLQLLHQEGVLLMMPELRLVY